MGEHDRYGRDTRTAWHTVHWPGAPQRTRPGGSGPRWGPRGCWPGSRHTRQTWSLETRRVRWEMRRVITCVHQAHLPGILTHPRLLTPHYPGDITQHPAPGHEHHQTLDWGMESKPHLHLSSSTSSASSLSGIRGRKIMSDATFLAGMRNQIIKELWVFAFKIYLPMVLKRLVKKLIATTGIK